MHFSRPILAIESSCDETAVAILDSNAELLVNLVASQSELHARFGGVVPEMASRNHLSTIDPLFHQALEQATMKPTDLGAVVATAGPGLAPALLVGASYAKGVALGLGIPYLAVNHLEGHLLSPFFLKKEIPEHLSLLVSGGHTQLTKVMKAGCYEVLGRTHDDAAGEAFDKVGKLLGLSYPGGVEIDRLAKQGDPKRYSFPRALLEKGNLDFSFSGLKTSVRYFLEKRNATLSSSELPDLCASFQEAVVAVLVEKTERAAKQEGLTCIALSGGVAANSRLQSGLGELCEKHHWKLHFPPPALIGDNAAMIAFAGLQSLLMGERTLVTQEIVPQWQL
ncbi:MAG: tRNA (adenosine(37)-N6)-threonylcarbamoyltransferase complex transferase subunit TsaD [Chthoniobacterales bacterium]